MWTSSRGRPEGLAEVRDGVLPCHLRYGGRGVGPIPGGVATSDTAVMHQKMACQPSRNRAPGAAVPAQNVSFGISPVGDLAGSASGHAPGQVSGRSPRRMRTSE